MHEQNNPKECFSALWYLPTTPWTSQMIVNDSVPRCGLQEGAGTRQPALEGQTRKCQECTGNDREVYCKE